jgi:ABC-type antimicrobial peptide transport system permease subunit
MDVNVFDVGTGYLSTIGATILEGRDFMENSQTDVDRSVIINEEMVRVMGWANPIDKRLVLRDTVPLNVIGVVKDIYFEGGLWDPLEPMLIRYVKEDQFQYLSVNANPEDILEVKALMDEKWKGVFPDELSGVRFLNQEKGGMALVNNNIKVMFIFLGLVALLLSAIGLFSLVSLNLVKRMKEIGVRKVLGASIQHITLKVSKEFFIILSIASILGCIGAYFLSDLLMSNIWAYHVPLEYFPFIASVFLLFVVNSITIGGKVFKAASTNPAQILKSE